MNPSRSGEDTVLTTPPPTDTSLLEVRRLDALVPYWRNPRLISDEAVNMVAESIRQFGYQQPIVVDADDVIIIGHTRYMALRRLGYTEVPVRVEATLTPLQVKQLRTIDNRSGEFTSWDFDKLMAELTTIDEELASRFFPEVAGPALQDTAGEVAVDVSPPPVEAREDNGLSEFICPSCFHSWEMMVTPAMVKSGKLSAR